MSSHRLKSIDILRALTMLLIHLKERKKMNYLLPFLLGFAAILMAFGYLTRPAWGISKNLATPSWTALCAGITALAFAAMYLLADKANCIRWAHIIEPAGSMTLTCYLLPYFVNAFRSISGITLPGTLTTGGVGILKSLLFAILIIQLTGLMGRLKIKLKI